MLAVRGSRERVEPGSEHAVSCTARDARSPDCSLQPLMSSRRPLASAWEAASIIIGCLVCYRPLARYPSSISGSLSLSLASCWSFNATDSSPIQRETQQIWVEFSRAQRALQKPLKMPGSSTCNKCNNQLHIRDRTARRPPPAHARNLLDNEIFRLRGVIRSHRAPPAPRARSPRPRPPTTPRRGRAGRSPRARP